MAITYKSSDILSPRRINGNAQGKERRRPRAYGPSANLVLLHLRKMAWESDGMEPEEGEPPAPSKLPQPHATSPAAFVASCRDCSPKSAARTASRSRRAATRLCALSSVHLVAKSPISGYSCSLITSSLCIAQPPQWGGLIFQICCPEGLDLTRDFPRHRAHCS